MLVLTFLFFGLSVFSKEFGLLLFPILMVHRLLFENRDRGGLNTLAVYLPLIFILIGYFLLRKTATGNWLTPSSGTTDLVQRLYFVPYLLIWNIRLILFPLNLHSFIVTYPTDYLNGQVLISVIGLGAIVLA